MEVSLICRSVLIEEQGWIQVVFCHVPENRQERSKTVHVHILPMVCARTLEHIAASRKGGQLVYIVHEQSNMAKCKVQYWKTVAGSAPPPPPPLEESTLLHIPPY